MVILAHHIEFNGNLCFPVGRHEIVFEFHKKCFEWEDLELVIVHLDPIFPVGTFQSSHHLHSWLLLSVCDIVPACNLELLEYFGIEISKMEDRELLPSCSQTATCFFEEEVGILYMKRVNSDERSDADEL